MENIDQILTHVATGKKLTLAIRDEGREDRNIAMAVIAALDLELPLAGFQLSDADFSGLDLSMSDFKACRFHNCDFSETNLTGCDISFCDLSMCKMADAIIIDADMRYSDFEGSDLENADISWSMITAANFKDAKLDGVGMESTFGVNEYIKCMQIDVYSVCYTKTHLQVQCQNHPIKVWKEMTARDQIQCGYKIGYQWAVENQEWLFKTMERYPAA